MKVAVIGAGISGLAAAYFLARRHDVLLFEQDTRAGGHSHTFVHRTPDGEQPVDTGFIVYNPPNYPNLSALFGELEVAVQATTMSFSVSLGAGAYEWMGSDRLRSVFAQPRNLFSPAHWRLIRDILRLNARCQKLLAQNALPDGTLGEFLASGGFSAELSSRYLLPMAGMIWSCSPRQATQYPAADFMRFFESHGLFSATRQPQWYSVTGGSRRYVDKLVQRIGGAGGRLQLGQGVEQLRRSDDGAPGAPGVIVRAGGAETRFDAVVSACHSDQALRMLGDASELEREVLGGIPYVGNRTLLHTDESFLPRRRAAWACWNYLHERDEVHDERIFGSYWMNRLQGIAAPRNYVVSLNPRREIAANRVLYETYYEHPHYSATSVRTHRLLPQLQGRGGLWWAGAWTRYGFHEDGLASGLRAVRGIDPACLPGWAAL